MYNIPYYHQISPPGGLNLKGANWALKLEEGRKLKGANWAPKIGGWEEKLKGVNWSAKFENFEKLCRINSAKINYFRVSILNLSFRSMKGQKIRNR